MPHVLGVAMAWLCSVELLNSIHLPVLLYLQWAPFALIPINILQRALITGCSSTALGTFLMDLVTLHVPLLHFSLALIIPLDVLKCWV